ncbi:uncharacterized protein L199_004388 [Kwoniella botswanensis]|uniref:uncharacterized protein n=1 Tax=Kwoniella botswanensis TaxID=1268659 RepID=UPI00315C9BD8
MSTPTTTDTNETPLPSPLSNSPPSPSFDKRSISTTDVKKEEGNQGDQEEQEETPRIPEHELRIYGLNAAVTAENLVNFFSTTTRVLGVLLHPQSTSSTTLQWAQLWVGSQAEVERCMDLKQHLAPSGITLSKAPSSAPPPSNQGLMTPELSSSNLAIDIRAPLTPPSLSRGLRLDSSGLGYRHIDPQGPLPRNLYVMGLPLDLTQVQFKSLFSQFGMVEHSTLLSQLDGMGRRRGFILMSTHREAVEAMSRMNGNWLEGFKIDVSWALVQRDSKNFGSIIHPPSVPTRRELSDDSAVLVENLDPAYFPNAGAVREIFSTFGPVQRVTIISVTPFQAVINFEHEVSATALINANGLSLGGRPVVTRRYTKPPFAIASPSREATSPGRLTFDPFGTDITNRLANLQVNGPIESSNATSLNANSAPFVPLPYSNARWLSSSSTNGNHMISQVESPKTIHDESSDSLSLTNSRSESTRNSGSAFLNGHGRSEQSGPKIQNENIAPIGHYPHAWPLPSESTLVPAKSRWTSAPK